MPKVIIEQQKTNDWHKMFHNYWSIYSDFTVRFFGCLSDYIRLLSVLSSASGLLSVIINWSLFWPEKVQFFLTDFCQTDVSKPILISTPED